MVVAALPVWAQPAPPPLGEQPAPPSPQSAPPAPAAVAVGAKDAAKAPSSLPDLLQTRIEQVRRGSRVTEVRVTGPAGDVRYTMDNPPAATAAPLRESGSGLSTPNFLRIEF